MKSKFKNGLVSNQILKSWEQTYIEFLVKLSKPIQDDLPVG